MLTERRAAILRAVVQQYIETAQPVGSTRIASQSEVAVSPATVRSEMTALERDGYLSQPHTSAGRVPTESAYRFFVQHIDTDVNLEAEQSAAVGDFFARAHGELEHLLRATSGLLVDLTQATAVIVTEPDAPDTTVLSSQLVVLPNGGAMAVAVMSDGEVVKARVAGASHSDVERADRELSALLIGRRLSDIGPGAGTAPMSPLAARCAAALDAEARADHTQVFIDGTSRMVRSFDAVGTLTQILGLLEQQLVVVGLLRSLVDQNFRIAIGSDTGEPVLSECALVLSPVHNGQRHAGTVAVLGPARMNYAETLAAVATVSERLGRVLTQGS